MSLFRAATMGVDPQTGSYLSKEQRVAMFQASRGRGGGGSGAPSGGGGGGGGVAPQNAIVVANKMATVVQTLQTNTQETVQAVNVKVEQNAQNIENLYKSVQRNRAAEAQQEKAETKLLRGEREAELRKGKEKLIEGLSSAVAGLASMGRRAAEAAMAPAMGFWERLKQFLLQLGMAFLIKNLPFIVGKIEEFGNWLGDFKNWFPESLTSLRGVWSIADNIIRMMWRGFRGFAGRVYRGATWLAGELYNIAKKIFTTIGNFIKNVVGDLAGYVSNAFKAAWSKLSSAFDDAWKGLKGWWNNRGGGGGTPSAPGGGRPALPGAADDAGGGLGAWVGKQWNRLSSWGKGVYSKGQEFLEQGGKAISGQLGKIQEGMTGVKPQGAPKRLGWIEDAIAPLIKRFPDMSGALSGLGKMFAGVSKAIPLIGFAIDLALNKGVAGQDWTEAIIRALGSSLAGGVSASFGAKIGAGIGGGVGAAALGIGAIPGAAIGAALGAIIAGIAGGWLGDQAGALTYEAFSGETRTENKPENNQNLTIEASEGMTRQGALHDPSQKENIQVQVKGTDGMVSTATDGSSTPDGMQEPDGGSRNTAEVVELDPQVVDARTGGDDEQPEIPGMIEEVPFWETSDPSADIYRSIASREYELTY